MKGTSKKKCEWASGFTSISGENMEATQKWRNYSPGMIARNNSTVSCNFHPKIESSFKDSLIKMKQGKLKQGVRTESAKGAALCWRIPVIPAEHSVTMNGLLQDKQRWPKTEQNTEWICPYCSSMCYFHPIPAVPGNALDFIPIHTIFPAVAFATFPGSGNFS